MNSILIYTNIKCLTKIELHRKKKKKYNYTKNTKKLNKHQKYI